LRGALHNTLIATEHTEINRSQETKWIAFKAVYNIF